MKWLLNLLGGGIADQLRRAYEARLAAQNDAERIAAEIQIAQLEGQRARALAGGQAVTAMAMFWAAPYALYDWKLLVWDKMLGWGVTDKLSDMLLETRWQILAFLFGVYAVRKFVGR